MREVQVLSRSAKFSNLTKEQVKRFYIASYYFLIKELIKGIKTPILDKMKFEMKVQVNVQIRLQNGFD